MLYPESGEYLAFVDSDDWLAAGCLEELLHNIDGAHLSIVKFGNYYQDAQRFENRPESHETVKCNDRKYAFDTLYGCTTDASK